ncbi:MAG: polysaccharide biosynthesis C-terminal domain-containing protein [Gaiellaceae bacterium]
MSRLQALRRGSNGLFVGNVAARVGGLACVFAITLLLARNGGAAVVGVYALLHVLPGLVGTLVSAGLPIAAPYFLAGPDRQDPRLPTTLAAIVVVGGAAGAGLWVAAAPLFGPYVFSGLSVPLVMFAGLLVLTRLIVISAKACSQGTEDLTGSNAIIFVEQLMFLPAYGLLWAVGARGFTIVIASLLLADCATGSMAWTRIVRRHFFWSLARPSRQLARRVAAYGMRGQVGGIMSQLNLRLDFIILSVMAGPAVLGVYAVASKFAELIRVIGMALTYVFYPRFAREGPTRAIEQSRRLLPKVGLLTPAVLAPLWITAGFVIPAFYGHTFEAAVTPTRIILFGLAFDGIAGVITGTLYGVGRPGLNSCAMGAGLVVTAVLDLTLIPMYGATGAAIASAAAYTTTAAALVGFFWWIARDARATRATDAVLAAGDAG